MPMPSAVPMKLTVAARRCVKRSDTQPEPDTPAMESMLAAPTAVADCSGVKPMSMR